MIIGHVNTDETPLLIAEIGNNHEGDVTRAFEMADAALDAGAQAVKFQIINPIRLVNRSQEQRIAQLTRFRLPLGTLVDIGERVKARGGLFMASVFDTDALAAVAPHLDAVKVASGDLDFTPLLATAAGAGKPIFLSTGMSSVEDIKVAVATIGNHLAAPLRIEDSLAILHCVSLYPTPLEKANLAAIGTLGKIFGLTVGYSDHTLGIEASVAAAVLGARVIEKHFTLDKAQSSFGDHALSADPDDMARLAQALAAVDGLIGSGARTGEMVDAATRAAVRRSIVAARDLPAGTVLRESDLDYVRPAGGLSPGEASRLIGKRLNTTLATHDLVQSTHVE